MVKPKTFKCPYCKETLRKEYFHGKEIITSFKEGQSGIYSQYSRSGWYEHSCKFEGEEKKAHTSNRKKGGMHHEKEYQSNRCKCTRNDGDIQGYYGGTGEDV